MITSRPRPARCTTSCVMLPFLLGSLWALPSGDSVAAHRAHAALFAELEAPPGWPKIHAAEALCAVGEKDRVRVAFLGEEKNSAWSGAALIGLWRVLATAAGSPEERNHWISRLDEVFCDPGYPYRLHALESLGKLGVAPTGALRDAIRSYSEKAAPFDALYAHWVLGHVLDTDDKQRFHSFQMIAEALSSPDPLLRQRAAYVVRWLKPRDPRLLAALRTAAQNEPDDAPSRAGIWGAAFVLFPENDAWRHRLEAILESGIPSGARYEASQCLLTAPATVRMNESRFLPLLDSSDADTRIGAAWALLSAQQASLGNPFKN